MPPTESASFGVLLHRHRLTAGLTQEVLAVRAGLSVRGVQDLERGEHHPLADTVQRLAAALGLVGAERAAFVRAGAALPRERARPAHPDRARYGLPAEVTSFVGRGRELDALGRLLTGTRLLTLTGPPGVGKTRLAVRLAAAVAPQFPDGAAFVSLAELTDPGLVLPAAARAFGVQPGPRELGDVLAEWLRPRRLLLVLDNCEQVAAAGPAFGHLVQRCPRLVLLATSRTPLQLYGEQAFAVPPLGLPEADTHLPPEALCQIEAVALFLARAQGVQPDFALTLGNAAAVAAICRRLDGLPLAIELAAAWARLLPPAALLRRLERRLALLTIGPADLPARQRTLRATLDWSYELLRPSERSLLRRLGVFAGGAALESIEPVATAAGPLDLDLLECLDGLVRHSLLDPEERDGEPRFRMLETVREFALEQLALAGEVEATRAAHAEALLRRLDGELGPEPWGPGMLWSALSLSQLELERENLRLALGWCAEQDDAERGLRLVTRSGRLWWQAGPRAEGLGWLRGFLGRMPPALPARLRFRALCCAGLLARWLGDMAGARAYFSEGLAVAEARQAEPEAALFLALSGDLAIQLGDLATAQAAIDPALARAGRTGPARYMALALLGTLAQLRGELAVAATRYREALAVFDGPTSWQWPRRALGYVALESGRLEEAADRFRENLADTWSWRMDYAVVEQLHAYAALARTRGDWDWAGRLLGAADAGLERLGGVLVEPIGRRERERTLAAAREHLGEPAFAASYVAGRALTLDQAVAEALAQRASTDQTSAPSEAT